MKLLTYDPAKKKKVLIGEIIGDTLFRWVKPEHYMQVVGGYGIQEVGFQEALKRQIRWIILKAEWTYMRWKADIETWKIHGRVADYGHGKQRFLSLKYMRSHNVAEQDWRTKKKEEARQAIEDAGQGRLV